jgi:hypothetical protein
MTDKDRDLMEIDRQWRLLHEHLGADDLERPGELLDRALSSRDEKAQTIARTLLQLMCKATIGRATTRLTN